MATTKRETLTATARPVKPGTAAKRNTTKANVSKAAPKAKRTTRKAVTVMVGDTSPLSDFNANAKPAQTEKIPKKRGVKASGNTARQIGARLKEQDKLVKEGRPLMLTPEMQNKIVSYIRSGNYAHVAAVASGISERTFLSWMERGRDEDSVEPFRSFFTSIKEAEANSEILTVALIRNQVNDNWTAGMTWLERRFKGRWSRQDQIVHETPDGKPLQIESTSSIKLEDLTQEQKKLLLALSSSLVVPK